MFHIYSLNQYSNASLEEGFIDSKGTNGLIDLPNFSVSSCSIDQYVWLSLHILYESKSYYFELAFKFWISFS